MSTAGIVVHQSRAQDDRRAIAADSRVGPFTSSFTNPLLPDPMFSGPQRGSSVRAILIVARLPH